MQALILKLTVLASTITCACAALAQPVQLTNFRPSFSSTPPDITSSISGDGRMFFVRRAGNEFELGVSDATPGGSAIVRFVAQSASMPSVDGAVIVGGQLYYTESLPGGARDLWTSDGTALGTRRVADVNPAGPDRVDPSLVGVGTTVYFVERSSAAGAEVWRTDGSAGSTHITVETVPGGGSNAPEQLTSFAGRLYFVTRSDTEHTLVRLDEAAGSIVRVFGVPSPAGAAGTAIGSLTVAGNTMYFAASPAEGRRLYSIQAATDTVTSVIDLPSASPPANTPSIIDNATPVASSLAFARRGQDGATRWWISDGTAAGTAMIAGSSSFFAPPGIAGDSVGTRVYYRTRDVFSQTGLDRFDVASGEVRRIREPASGFPTSGRAIITTTHLLYRTSEPTSQPFFVGVRLGTETFTQIAHESEPGAGTQIQISLAGAQAVGDHLLFFAARGGSQNIQSGLFAQSLGSASPDQTTHLLALGSGELNYSPLVWDGSQVLVHIRGPQNPSMITIDGTTDAVEVATQADPLGVNVLGRFDLARERALVGTEFNPSNNGTFVMGRLDGSTFSRVGNPDPLNRVGTPLAQAGSFFVFAPTISTTTQGPAIGVSDGTQAGTRVIALDPSFGILDPSPERWAGLSGRVVFATRSSSTLLRAFGVTDGTVAGTRLITPWSNILQDRLWATSNRVIMIGGNTAWSSDGTEAGTRQFELSAAEPFLSCQAALGVLGDSVYFRGSGLSGAELYATDGTPEGTRLVRDLGVGTLSSSPFRFASAGGRGFFVAQNGTGGPDVWALEGTAPIARFGPSDGVFDIAASDERVFFAARVGGAQRVYSSAGTAATLISAPVPVNSITSLTPLGSVALFAGQDSNGRELWRSDGTAAGTFQVFDPSGIADSSIFMLTRVGDRAFFQANVPAQGFITYRSDGTPAGTVPAFDPVLFGLSALTTEPLVGGFQGQYVANFRDVREALVMLSPVGTPPLLLTLGGPFTIAFGHPEMVSASASDALYYFFGSSLFRTDGTVNGTFLLDSLDTNLALTGRLVTVGSRLFYNGSRGGNTGTLLYDYNGAPGRPRAVTNAQGQPVGANRIQQVGNKVYFFGGFGANGAQSNALGVTDGTPASTVILRSFDGTELGAALNDIYVFGASISSDSEPWISNGTVAGTQRLRDIVVGTGGSSPGNFIRAGRYVYFTATTAANGRELYRTDGTAARTSLIQNLTPGAGSSTFTNFVPVGEYLYFTYFDGISTEIYRTNGALLSISPVTQRDANGQSSAPSNLVAGADSLYFTALAPNGLRQVFRITGAPLCPADFDQSGYLNPDDLADYIASYFQSPPDERADFDGNGDVDPDDLADFIVAYFTGCA